MIRIKQLPAHEACKIAAGEVVDRPSNVVKELVENAIDAGATRIYVYVENAGHTSIRIVDNGCGMSSEDARLSIAQYATSKITTVDDLALISTFGFRGEALASIAAVSKVTLVTKEHEADQGILLNIENGNIIKETMVSCNTGTDITIQDLFYNVPVRKKFLKKPETEWRAIVHLIHAFCFSNLLVSFKLFHDGRQVILCPPVECVTDRVRQLWDRTASHNMVTLTTGDTKKQLSITGLISTHQYYRYDRTQIYFFVNKRWVKNYALGNALVKGYLNVIPSQRAPLAVLFITVDQMEVDVNIHPRKEEVQFLHPRSIESLLQSSVKETLEEHLSAQIKKSAIGAGPSHQSIKNGVDSLSPSRLQVAPNVAQPQLDTLFVEFDSSVANSERIDELFMPGTAFAPASQSSLSVNFDQKIHQVMPSLECKEESLAAPELEGNSKQTERILEQQKISKTYQLIGQYKKTYLLLEQDDGLFLVDQHAAHERILYELFESRFQEVATVALLFPHVMTLSEDDFRVVMSHVDLFSNHGILIEPFGSNQLIVQSIPVYLKDCMYDELIKQIIGLIKEEQNINHVDCLASLSKKMRAQMACKAAVKAGDELTWQQMETLLVDLSNVAHRFTCPHGRPTGWLLSLYDIEKKFKRKV